MTIGIFIIDHPKSFSTWPKHIFLRIILIGQVQPEKHAKIVEDALKDLLKMVILETRTHVASTAKLNRSFNERFSSHKRPKEEISTLKDDLLETFDMYFEQANE